MQINLTVNLTIAILFKSNHVFISICQDISSSGQIFSNAASIKITNSYWIFPSLLLLLLFYSLQFTQNGEMLLGFGKLHMSDLSGLSFYLLQREGDKPIPLHVTEVELKHT